MRKPIPTVDEANQLIHEFNEKKAVVNKGLEDLCANYRVAQRMNTQLESKVDELTSEVRDLETALRESLSAFEHYDKILSGVLKPHAKANSDLFAKANPAPTVLNRPPVVLPKPKDKTF